MKVHTIFATFGFAAAATTAHAQTAPAPVDPLTSLQNAFGTVVGNAFHAPDRIAAVVVPQADATLSQPIGGALRTSLQVPGAAFAALFLPFDSDAGAAAAAAATPAPAPPPPASRRRRGKVAHHRVSGKPMAG